MISVADISEVTEVRFRRENFSGDDTELIWVNGKAQQILQDSGVLDVWSEETGTENFSHLLAITTGKMTVIFSDGSQMEIKMQAEGDWEYQDDHVQKIASVSEAFKNMIPKYELRI